MRKNISQLIVQVSSKTASSVRPPFKITSKNAAKYTNKIVVDEEEYNKPSHMEAFVHQEMLEYPQIEEQQLKQNRQVENLKATTKKKIEKNFSLEDSIYLLQKNITFFNVQQLSDLLKYASQDELFLVREKLKKLESNLSFSLENEELQQHIKVRVTNFLFQLTHIINKRYNIY